MGNSNDLFEADATRRGAMISGDTSRLEEIFSNDLVWTHSSGKTENKTDVINAIAGKSVSYETLEIKEYSISRHGDIFIYNGILDGRASRDGVEKNLKSKFLSVWQWTGSAYEMLAWQSTGF